MGKYLKGDWRGEFRLFVVEVELCFFFILKVLIIFLVIKKLKE